jgi:hypothetical protein
MHFMIIVCNFLNFDSVNNNNDREKMRETGMK